ncbi:FAD binding domain-containing protein [Melanogaster broomeanus]|nr:FAD binding domain-containing protein [Melanogaster broomeanus]
MTTSTLPVLVAGAGPAGLVAALALLQNDIPVRIIDKEPQHRIGQRGAGIWPRTFEVFHFLGVPEVHETAKAVIPVREYKSGTLEPAKTYMMAAHNEPHPLIPYNNAKLIGQQTLEGILRSHLEKKYNCFVELATELQSFDQDGDRVFAKLVKKTNGGHVSEVLEAAYLLGTDGARGVTRKQLGLTFLGETRDDFRAIIGDVRLEIKGLDRDHWHFFGDRASSLVTLRPPDEIAPDGFQLLLASKDHDLTKLLDDKKSLFQCISEVIGAEVDFREIAWFSEFRPNIRMVDKFGIGRAFVAGDAAHVHSPTGGQGLNSSVQDAFNIAWKISLVYKGLSPASLLDSYTIERIPVIAEMLNITSTLLQRIQDAPLERAMEREKKLDMLGINYRFSPIVREEFSADGPVSAYRVLEEGVLVAGDRAPDAPRLRLGADDGATSLFAVFSPKRHTVLVFGPDVASAADILDALSTYPRAALHSVVVLPQASGTAATSEVDVLVDEAGHAYRGYLAAKGERRVVVVRPDGVVGAIVRGAEGVTAYFEKIFV